ncbi:DsbA family protein [Myxococcota bacterium]|nr:DsbA family protein [Myxococcota bacterium]
MEKLLNWGVAPLALAIVAGCQPTGNPELEKKVEDLTKRVAALEARPAAPARPQAPQGPDPMAVYAVPVDNAPAKGPKHAKVTIVEAFEFACPFCERVRPTIAQLQKDYGDQLRIVAKQYVVHPQVATIPALAACAANKQGKYSAMEELLWEKGYKANRNFSQENVDALAKEAGLDLDKYKAELTGDCQKLVQQQQAELASFGVRGTPAFFINGRYLSGAQPIENFKRLVDEELAKANAAIEKGTKVEDYYAEAVLKNGKKSL